MSKTPPCASVWRESGSRVSLHETIFASGLVPRGGVCVVPSDAMAWRPSHVDSADTKDGTDEPAIAVSCWRSEAQMTKSAAAAAPLSVRSWTPGLLSGVPGLAWDAISYFF
jgi:hypothetical protein